MGRRTEFLYLSEQDTIKAGVLNAADCVDNAEEIFKILGKGDYLMGGSFHNSHGIGLIFPKTSPFPNMPLAGPDRRFFSMLAYVGDRFDVCGDKWYGSNTQNKKKGLPRSVLSLVINDKETGEPLSLMSANLLSAARTGAVPGVAARHLPNKDAKVCAVIGCGNINKFCYSSIMSQMPGIKKVVCNDIVEEKAKEFLEFSKKEYGIDGFISIDYEETLKEADVVSVAASRIKPVYFKDEWAKKGTTFLISGPIKGSDAFWLNSKIILDHVPLHENYFSEAIASGDIPGYYEGVIGGPIYALIDKGQLPPLKEFTGMGQILLREKEGRTSREERIIFVACGMATFDVGLGYDSYQNALKKGIGKKMLLWDQPTQA